MSGNPGYVGLPKTPGLPPNRYTDLGRFPQALSIVRGTVIGAYQGSNYYDVASEVGRVEAFGLGAGTGLLGSMDASGFLPGEQVFVAVSPSAPAMNAFIVGRADYARAGNYERQFPLLVYPQVAGFKPTQRFSGKAYSNFPRLRNFNSGLLDVVDGEWVQHNMMGGALGIEMFRSFLQAGPMCGVYAYSEDQHLKLVAARLSIETLHGKSETLDLGGSTVDVNKKYYYLGDQGSGWQGQKQTYDGVIFSGDNEFLTYPDGTNGSDSRESTSDEGSGQSRVALVHEHKGVDGSYILSAASSVTLQKTLSIPIPIDVVEAEAFETEDEVAAVVEEGEEAAEGEEDNGEEEETSRCCASATLTPDPKSALCKSTSTGEEDECESVVKGPYYDSFNSTHPLAFAMNARGMADRLIWNVLAGALNLCRYVVADKPSSIYGAGEADVGERTNAQLNFNPDPGMWKNMPQTVRLAIAPTGESKRVYWGRALITITEDGSIVMQDAHGSSIMLSGGNIYLSANHDVISVAGRNKLDVAGRDMGQRAGRHLDLAANEGRLTAIAAGQATLAGGLDGHGGVLIESKGEYGGADAAGENPPTAGGVTIKAKHMVGLKAPNLTLQAKGTGWNSNDGEPGHLYIDVGTSVEINCGDYGTIPYYSIGNTFEAYPTSDAALMMGNRGVVLDGNMWIKKNLFYNKQFYHDERSQGGVGYRFDGIRQTMPVAQKAMMDFACSPLVMGNNFTAKWLSSAQYTINSALYFQLPEPEWQIRAKGALDERSSVLQALMIDNTVESTSPFPGSEAWTDYGMATGGYTETADFNEEPDIDMNIGEAALDGGLLKGI